MKWTEIKKRAEQWLHMRVRHVIGEISDDSAEINEFLNLDDFYVSGSTVAYSVALARGTVSEPSCLPGDLDLYAKNPLKVATTKIGKHQLGVYGTTSKSEKRKIDLVPLVFNDVREVLDQFDTIMVQCAYDIKRNELVGFSHEYVKLMETESPVFTYTIERKDQDDRKDKCKSRAKTWFGGSMIPNKDRLYVGKDEPQLELSVATNLMPWMCKPVVNSFINYTCKTCFKNCVLNGTFWSCFGYCGPCYRMLDMVSKSALMGRQFNFKYARCSLGKGLPEALKYYGIQKNSDAPDFILKYSEFILKYSCGSKSILYTRLRIIAQKYRNSKRLTRIVFIGVPYSLREVISKMASQLAAINFQVLVYDGPEPTTTLEWGLILMNYYGIFDTDNLDTIQPAFRRTGKINSKSPVYPDTERTISFLETASHIVRKQELVQKEALKLILASPNFWRYNEDLSEESISDKEYTSQLIRNERDLLTDWQKRPKEIRKEILIQCLYILKEKEEDSRRDETDSRRPLKRKK
jgi:hypothetical protein